MLVVVVAKLAVAVAVIVVVEAAVVVAQAVEAVAVVAQAVVESAAVKVEAVERVVLSVLKLDYSLEQRIRTHLLMRRRKVNVARPEQHQCSMA